MRRLALLERAKAKKPPPSMADALLHGGRWRMIGLFLGLFLVMKLFDITRNPDSWRWFERMTTDVENSEINTKLPPRPNTVELRDGIVAHPSRPIITKYTATDTPEEAPVHVDAFERVWRETWRDIFQHLNYAERGLIYRGLKLARDGETLAAEYQPAFSELCQRLDMAWSAYRIEATAGLKDVAEEQKGVWLDLLQRTGSKWSQELMPAFESLSKGEVVVDPAKKSLAELQALLDSVLLASVQDDTVWRATEAEISFRLFEQARHITAADKETAIQATFLQLFKQSADYRGKTVHVRGTAKQAWHVKAPSNWVGIEGYYVFVIRPNDVNSPIVVYSLELPPGFPPVKDKDLDGGTTNLDDEIEFTGIFLKRWAYTGRDGTYTAPLIIAKRAEWKPPPRALGEPMTPAEFQKSLLVTGGVAAVMGCLLLAAIIFWPRTPARVLPTAEELQPKLRELENVSTTTVAEELRRLELGAMNNPEEQR